MKLLLTLLLCLMACLSINSVQAQHIQRHQRYVANRGEAVEYDTAVVVNVSAYRDDLRALRRKNFIIDSLQADLNALYAERNQQSVMAGNQQNEENDRLEPGLPQSQVSKKNKWYMNPIFGLGAGLLIGIYLIPDNSL